MPKTAEHVIEYELDLEELEAAEHAAREQYEATLYHVRDGLPSLDQIDTGEDGEMDDAQVPELGGHIRDLLKDLKTWEAAAEAVFKERARTAQGEAGPNPKLKPKRRSA
jgi:hypothetical protein